MLLQPLLYIYGVDTEYPSYICWINNDCTVRNNNECTAYRNNNDVIHDVVQCDYTSTNNNDFDLHDYNNIIIRGHNNIIIDPSSSLWVQVRFDDHKEDVFDRYVVRDCNDYHVHHGNESTTSDIIRLVISLSSDWYSAQQSVTNSRSNSYASGKSPTKKKIYLFCDSNNDNDSLSLFCDLLRSFCVKKKNICSVYQRRKKICSVTSQRSKASRIVNHTILPVWLLPTLVVFTIVGLILIVFMVCYVIIDYLLIVLMVCYVMIMDIHWYYLWYSCIQ